MQKIVLITGTGMCGMAAAVDVLNRQRGCRGRVQTPPYLPWDASQCLPQQLRARLDRIRREHSRANIVVDAGSFYLPYVDEILEIEPACRIVCLQRPMQEVVSKFLIFLRNNHSVPTTYWAEKPPPGWQVDPIFTPLYPPQTRNSLAETISAYWEQYTSLAEHYSRLYPEKFRIFEAAQGLDTAQGLIEFLAFIGIPPQQQRPVAGRFAGSPETTLRRLRPPAPRPTSTDSNEPSRCVVLVSYHSHIKACCDRSLKELEKRGYPIRRVAGFAAIDQARNQLVTDALIDGYEETLLISPNIGFRSDDVDRIRTLQLPICCDFVRTDQTVFMHQPQNEFSGQPHGLSPIAVASANLLHIRRNVYLRVLQHSGLPICNERFGHPLIPFFRPMHFDNETGSIYLDDIQAFSRRVQDSGYDIFADPTIEITQ